MKRALSFFLTCILLLGLLPTSALAADPPAEQFPTLIPGGIYWFDLSGEGIPGSANSDIPDPTFHWVPFTYAGTINAYVLTGRSSTDEAAKKDSQTAAAIDSPNPIGCTYDHSLFVGDYNVTRYVSWNDLNEKNLIFGKSYTSDGVEYTMRAPSVGSYTSDLDDITKVTPQNNEWNTILNRSDEYIKNSGDMYSWGQDTTAYWSERAGQGRQAPTRPPAWFRAEANYKVGNIGYRPILELKLTGARPDEMKIVRLDLNGGKAGTTSAAQDGTIQIVVRDAIGSKSFTAPSSEGLSSPQWRVFKNWKGSNNTVYDPGDPVPTSVTSLTAQWKTPLSITEQPRAAFSPEGQTASFAVAAVSDLSITYQWQVNRGSQWENISGAVTSGYTTGPVGMAMNGWKYRCVVSSGSETKTSDAVMLTLEQYPVLDPGETYWFDLSKASVPGTALESSPDPTLHWVPFTYTGTINAYKLTKEQETTEEYAEANRYDHSLFIADYPVTSVSRYSLNYSYGTIFGRTYTSSGVAYTMRLPSAGSASTGYGDSMRGTPQSNEWDMILNKSDEYIKNWGDTYSWGQDKYTGYNTYVLRGGPYLRYWIDDAIRPGSTDTRRYSYRPVLELPVPGALASGLRVVTLDLNGGKAGTTDTAQSGTINIVVKSGEDFKAPGGEGLTVPDGKLQFSSWKDGNGTAYQAGGNVPASVTALTACWAVAPSVTAQPEDKTVSTGQTAEFTVQASGEPAPTYQWQVSKGSGSSWEDISGATSSSCATEAATADMNGWQYRCVVSNSQGNATSDAATLTVNAPYQIEFTGGQADGPTQITLNAAAVTPSGGTVTYARNTANEAPADGWQTELVFSGLTAGTTYYFFAKAAASGDYLETVSPGVAITTPAKSVSDIQITTQPANLTYTSGQALDLSGLSVTATYDDGTSETIDWSSGRLTASPAQGTALTVSEHNGNGVAISFGGKTANTNALTVTQGTQPPTKYLVTVNGGTGGGSYAEGEDVTITATTPSGQRFTGWTVNAGGVILADPSSATTTFTMPAQTVTVTANFEGTTAPTYLVTVNGGTGSGSYAAGEDVTITATTPSGQRFTGWTVNAGAVILADPSSATTTFTMPAQAVTVTANFEGTTAPTYLVTVNGGTGSGSYAEGEDVTITATAPSGQRFTGWTVNAGGVILADPSSATTTFTMPAQTVTVTANFEGTTAPTYLVTVNGGTGGGSYAEGEDVTITATAPSGQRFTGWTVNAGGVILADPSSATTTFTMPAQAVTVTANFESNSGGGNYDGGSTYTPPTYPPTVERPGGGGGAATVSPSNPKQGDTVTVTPKPDSGYEVDKITVADRNGRPVTVTARPDGTYTFVQPGGRVTIKIEYAPVPLIDQPWTSPFSDVAVGDWYYEAVRFVQERGLMNGYSDGRFGLNDNLSRAQLAQILFNKEGRPGVNYLLTFSDVAGEVWYTEAIRWATSQGIVGGYGNGRFGPNDPITREQLAVVLWRYSGSPAATNKELHFNDADEISPFALEALRWAVENGILNGYGDGRLGPQGQATRAQVAQMLKNFFEKG